MRPPYLPPPRPNPPAKENTNMSTEKAMQVVDLINGTIECAKANLASKDDAKEHCVTLIEAHTAEALAEYKRVLGAAKVLIERLPEPANSYSNYLRFHSANDEATEIDSLLGEAHTNLAEIAKKV